MIKKTLINNSNNKSLEITSTIMLANNKLKDNKVKIKI